MSGRIGFTPVPNFSDEEFYRFLQKTISHDIEMCNEILEDLIGETKEVKERGKPEEFTYAKLMNYLADLPKPVRIHLCAAALWKLHGQNNAEIHVLPIGETDTD